VRGKTMLSGFSIRLLRILTTLRLWQLSAVQWFAKPHPRMQISKHASNQNAKRSWRNASPRNSNQKWLIRSKSNRDPVPPELSSGLNANPFTPSKRMDCTVTSYVGRDTLFGRRPRSSNRHGAVGRRRAEEQRLVHCAASPPFWRTGPWRKHDLESLGRDGRPTAFAGAFVHFVAPNGMERETLLF
jgi:hypothetical protein